MSRTLLLVQELVEQGNVRISAHGYDELAEDGISTRDVVSGVGDAVVVEDYPDFGKGPVVLVREYDAAGSPIHVVWGIPKGRPSPAVLVTAYRPDPNRWSADFLRRRP